MITTMGFVVSSRLAFRWGFRYDFITTGGLPKRAFPFAHRVTFEWSCDYRIYPEGSKRI